MEEEIANEVVTLASWLQRRKAEVVLLRPSWT